MEFPEIKSDGGLRVVIYSTSAGGDQPIHGAWFYDDGSIKCWRICAWQKDGKRARLDSVLDIKEAVNAGQVKAG